MPAWKKVHPPDGEHENWWQRLNNALPAQLSSDFTECRAVPNTGCMSLAFGRRFRKLSMNAALAMIEAVAPKDEIEGALAVGDGACTHAAAIAIFAKLDDRHSQRERRVAAFGSTAARLMKAYATQVEVLRRLRHGGHQVVRVEHVHVNDGGQAVIGNVKKSDEGG